tara:strand:+ start:260 stop:508 length:249 start_codon:yes stop_codon:yes gene_type:complete
MVLVVYLARITAPIFAPASFLVEQDYEARNLSLAGRAGGAPKAIIGFVAPAGWGRGVRGVTAQEEKVEDEDAVTQIYEAAVI